MSKRTKEGGFSLIEIMVVLGVIAVLTGIAVPAYNSYIEKGKIAEAMSDLKRIQTAIIALATDTGEWPGHQSIGKLDSGGSNEIWNLNAATAGLTADDPGTAYPNWNGPYITSVPLDPWGTNYFMDTDYTFGGTVVAIGSFGPDKCCWSPQTYDSNNEILILPLK